MSESIDIQQLANIFANNYEHIRNEEMSETEIRKYYEALIPESEYKEQIVDSFVERFEDLQSTELNSYEAKEIFINTFSITTQDGEIISFNKPIETTEDGEKSPTVSEVGRTSNKTSAALQQLKHFRPSQNTFLVSIDGSTTSDYAFEGALRLRFPSDKVVLFHTYTADCATTLPKKYQHDELKSLYSTKLDEKVSPTDYHMAFLERKDPHQTSKDVLIEIVKLCTDTSKAVERETKLGPNLPNFVVLGFSGRNNEMENRPSFMGSSTNIALRSWQLPVIITKALCQPDQRTFVMAADCTEPSKRGLDVIASIIRPTDFLILLHILSSTLLPSSTGGMSPAPMSGVSGTSVSSGKRLSGNVSSVSGTGGIAGLSGKYVSGDVSVNEFYREDVERLGIQKPEYITIPRETGSGASLSDVLINAVNNDISPDFLVLVPRSRKHITSITEDVIFRSKCSVILCNSL